MAGQDPDDWEGHPNTPVSDEELRRLIAEDARYSSGRGATIQPPRF